MLNRKWIISHLIATILFSSIKLTAPSYAESMSNKTSNDVGWEIKFGYLIPTARRSDLPWSPIKTIISKKSLFVIGNSGKKYYLSSMSLDLSDKNTTINLEKEPIDAVSDYQNGYLYTLYKNDIGVDIVAYNKDLILLGSKLIETDFSDPRIFLINSHQLIVVQADNPLSSPIDQRLISVDSFDPSSMSVATDFTLRVSGGLERIWVDGSGKVIFLQSSFRPVFTVYDRDLERSTAYISFDTGQVSGDSINIFGFVNEYRCEDLAKPQFLIANSILNQLSLVEYDYDFESFSVLSNTSGLEPDDRAYRIPQREELSGGYLLSSSCDQSVIVVGDRDGYTINQYAKNSNGNIIEYIGRILSPAPVSELNVSPDGDFTIVTSQRDNSVRRYEPLDLVLFGPEAADAKPSIVGDLEIRKLQRKLTTLGYPTGPIDGILGSQTLMALDTFSEQNQVPLDPNSSVDMILQSVEAWESSTYKN